jgi:hypothetical protein
MNFNDFAKKLKADGETVHIEQHGALPPDAAQFPATAECYRRAWNAAGQAPIRRTDPEP